MLTHRRGVHPPIISLVLLSLIAARASAQGVNEPAVAIDDFYVVDQLGALNEPAPGVLVNDSDPNAGDTLTAAMVTGPSHAASFQLNSDGSFSYVPLASYYGPDTFTYQAYDGTVHAQTATVNITVRQSCSQGFITGGGKFFYDGRKCTFGFVAKVQGNGAQGTLEFQDHGMGIDVKADTVDWVFAPNQIDGYFSGACSVNHMTGYSYLVQVHDWGQPGSKDDFSVWIYDSYNVLVYTPGGLLSGGNIVIHDVAPVSPKEWWCDYDQDGYTVYAGFSCTAPSPYCYEDPGLGLDCDDNDPNVGGGVGSKHWWCDNDQDYYYAYYGVSCTAPSPYCVESPPPPAQPPGAGSDYDDNNDQVILAP